ncbi:uncharacterized protein ASPGLDRAFT_1386841 [Aspergillus glaucus CBS 516.65]|uniref:Uncharacterized protein n=1 Tax=Aspergillus glaucus CBS 516.65 TaxID=1160497 RepID=A0A1L9VPC2_ASPGL|nr:hypothetical protein ASPGLDRAFT_1386841 [Aspergillus glaucus CBS 516.65]OJJ85742.1 hypothetical protein ASPGLDRAFT_1386841 [Aspergillus glaucus CBS 516.65]
MQEIKDHCSITSSFMCYQDWLHKQETMLNPLTLAFRHFLLLPALFALALFSSLSSPLPSSLLLTLLLFSSLPLLYPDLVAFCICAIFGFIYSLYHRPILLHLITSSLISRSVGALPLLQ